MVFYDDTTRETGAPGCILDVRDICRLDGWQLHISNRQGVEGSGCIDHTHVQPFAGFPEEGEVTLRGDADRRIAGFEQPLQLGNVRAVRSHFDGGGQGDGDKARILTGVEEANEVRLGLRDKRHPITFVQAKT